MKLLFYCKILIFNILFFTAVSCETAVKNNKTGSNKSVKNVQQRSVKTGDNTAEVISKFKVVLVDSTAGLIQRVFVVIDSNNISVIRNAICNIYENYQLTEKSNISFFSDEKYANYKDELFYDESRVFNDENKYLPKEEYKNWLNYYYLAEYELKSKELVLFPASDKQKNEIQIVPCEE